MRGMMRMRDADVLYLQWEPTLNPNPKTLNRYWEVEARDETRQ